MISFPLLFTELVILLPTPSMCFPICFWVFDFTESLYLTKCLIWSTCLINFSWNYLKNNKNRRRRCKFQLMHGKSKCRLTKFQISFRKCWLTKRLGLSTQSGKIDVLADRNFKEFWMGDFRKRLEINLFETHPQLPIKSF